MILVDTSVWIDHLRQGVPQLVTHLRRGDVVVHPFVIGELACGNLSNREAILEFLQQLRSVSVAEHDEVMSYIRARKLYGRGIGYVDAHLLAAATIDGCQLWTKDRRLHGLAVNLGVTAN